VDADSGLTETFDPTVARSRAQSHLAAMRIGSVPAALALFVAATSCAPAAPPASPASHAPDQQRIVDRAALAVRTMRTNPHFGYLDAYFAEAKGVLIFPRVIKAALIFGGGGGNGVLLVHHDDGSWSAPAFYSIGGGSAGFQVGFEQATVVLFLMDPSTLASVRGTGLTLGTDVTVAAGTIGDSGKSRHTTASKGIVEMTSVGGVFAGVSLAGAVVAPRETFNQAYYGAGATTADILTNPGYETAPGTTELRQALAPTAR
jgi:SH3 domain-containing YSC84-like protein 1